VRLASRRQRRTCLAVSGGMSCPCPPSTRCSVMVSWCNIPIFFLNFGLKNLFCVCWLKNPQGIKTFWAIFRIMGNQMFSTNLFWFQGFEFFRKDFISKIKSLTPTPSV
jgi:hypothetical protein